MHFTLLYHDSSDLLKFSVDDLSSMSIVEDARVYLQLALQKMHGCDLQMHITFDVQVYVIIPRVTSQQVFTVHAEQLVTCVGMESCSDQFKTCEFILTRGIEN